MEGLMSKQVAFPIGLTVVEVREMTKEELDYEAWESFPSDFTVVIVFNDGSKIYASSDCEGNGPGALFGVTKKYEGVMVCPIDRI
jgi:hypothetical protein